MFQVLKQDELFDTLFGCPCLFQVSIRDKVFDTLLFFLDYPEEEVQLKALTGLGQ